MKSTLVEGESTGGFVDVLVVATPDTAPDIQPVIAPLSSRVGWLTLALVDERGAGIGPELAQAAWRVARDLEVYCPRVVVTQGRRRDTFDDLMASERCDLLVVPTRGRRDRRLRAMIRAARRAGIPVAVTRATTPTIVRSDERPRTPSLATFGGRG